MICPATTTAVASTSPTRGGGASGLTPQVNTPGSHEPSQKVGRGTYGGNPSGVVSGETFRWWKRMVEENPTSIIISAHHYMLKNTTVASGEWEGFQRDTKGVWKERYHGYWPDSTPQGASYLYWVDSKPDSGAFENFLGASPGRVALWLGGHTHTAPGDTYGAKSHIERRWGTTFINVAGLTKYMGAPENCVPRSWLLTFTDGSDEVTAQCYLHTSDYAQQGWYSKFDRMIKLSKPFKMPSEKAGVVGITKRPIFPEAVPLDSAWCTGDSDIIVGLGKGCRLSRS